jgi:hypothetical protein
LSKKRVFFFKPENAIQAKKAGLVKKLLLVIKSVQHLLEAIGFIKSQAELGRLTPLISASLEIKYWLKTQNRKNGPHSGFTVTDSLSHSFRVKAITHFLVTGLPPRGGRK